MTTTLLLKNSIIVTNYARVHITFQHSKYRNNCDVIFFRTYIILVTLATSSSSSSLISMENFERAGPDGNTIALSLGNFDPSRGQFPPKEYLFGQGRYLGHYFIDDFIDPLGYLRRVRVLINPPAAGASPQQITFTCA